MQVGLATISAGVQRAGGSKKHPGPALDEALELKAASIEGGASGEAIGMGKPFQASNTLMCQTSHTNILNTGEVTGGMRREIKCHPADLLWAAQLAKLKQGRCNALAPELPFPVFRTDCRPTGHQSQVHKLTAH